MNTWDNCINKSINSTNTYRCSSFKEAAIEKSLVKWYLRRNAEVGGKKVLKGDAIDACGMLRKAKLDLSLFLLLLKRKKGIHFFCDRLRIAFAFRLFQLQFSTLWRFGPLFWCVGSMGFWGPWPKCLRLLFVFE